MSDEPNNGGNDNGKPYAEMSPAERARLMNFILHSQAQFFADIEAIKETQARNAKQIEALLTVDERHERRLQRAENIIRSAVVIGRRERARIRANEKALDMVTELLLDNAQRTGELRQTQAENARQLAGEREARQASEQRLDRLAAMVEKLAERDGNGAA